MSLTDSGLSASDVLALTANNNNDGFGGGNFGGGHPHGESEQINKR